MVARTPLSTIPLPLLDLNLFGALPKALGSTAKCSKACGLGWTVSHVQATILDRLQKSELRIKERIEGRIKKVKRYRNRERGLVDRIGLCLWQFWNSNLEITFPRFSYQINDCKKKFNQEMFLLEWTHLLRWTLQTRLVLNQVSSSLTVRQKTRTNNKRIISWYFDPLGEIWPYF